MTKGTCCLLMFLLPLTVDLYPTIVVQDNDFIITEKTRLIKRLIGLFFPAEDIFALQEKHRRE